jgi:phenylalanyl-tRNA synthetase beta chain
MKVSELWLKSFIDFPLSVYEIVEQFTNAGIEVESLEFMQDPKQAIWTFKIPPNRGDCLSMEGIARELSLLNRSTYQPVEVLEPCIELPDTLTIQIKNPELCPCYVGCVVKNIDPTLLTPVWLENRLTMAGIKSVNLVVDILNYVMIELGQPLHAFDLKKLNGGIVVRRSDAGESVVLWNGQTIPLKTGTLVVADQNAIQAIAGVMGAANSAITDRTNAIFIESAYFDPIAIRFAGEQYHLKTDASYRFERGIDPTLQQRALKRAIQLLTTTASTKAGAILETKNNLQPLKIAAISLRKKSIMRLLGMQFSDQEVLALLQPSAVKIEVGIEDFKVYPKPFRQDLVLEVDLLEEIARLYGFNHFKSKKLDGFLDTPARHVAQNTTACFRQLLINRGFYEVITYSFVDLALMELLNDMAPLMLVNPISAEMKAMRTNLWPGLLQAVRYNQRRQLPRVRLFECGNCFVKEKNQVKELEVLAGICAGPLYQEQWGVKKRMHDFYDVKGEVEALLALGQEQEIYFEKGEHVALHPGQTAKILKADQLVGYVGALHPRIVKSLELEGPLFVFELNMELLQKAKKVTFQDLSKFPSIRRDLAVLVQKTVLAADLKVAIQACAGELLHGITLFDVYEGEGIEPNKKSIALSLILQHSSRTLVESEVNNVVDRVMTMLSSQFQATLRI